MKKVKRVVVKIGSSSLTDNGCLCPFKVKKIVNDVTAVLKDNYEIVIVTSGAISAGCGLVNVDRKNMSIPEKQAMAAVGQTLLMDEYRKNFSLQGYNVAQILMTEDDVKNRRRFLNIRNTLNKLLEMNIVPIINENDTVVVKEIKFGDNDTLSAYVTNLIEANLLIILSDIDGFYDNLSDDKPVEIISSITKDVFRKAGGSSTEHGTGGMFTKIKAADMILKSGEMMVIAKAGLENIIYRIVKGEAVGTIFVNETNYLSSRKRWLAFNMKTSGRIYVDKGAEAALLEKKKSLLPIGITLVEGSFKQGDGVDICSQAGSVIARGIINYANDELQKIIGRKSKDIEEILGKKYYDEVVHRDNMVVNITGD